MFADIVSGYGTAADTLFFIAFLIYVVWIVLVVAGATLPEKAMQLIIPLPLALWVLALLLQ